MSDAGQRGPNYDWKHEAEHYRDECEKLKTLLSKVEASGERDAYERDQLDALVKQGASRHAQLEDQVSSLQSKLSNMEDLYNRKHESLESSKAVVSDLERKRQDLEHRLAECAKERDRLMQVEIEYHNLLHDGPHLRYKKMERYASELEKKLAAAEAVINDADYGDQAVEFCKQRNEALQWCERLATELKRHTGGSGYNSRLDSGQLALAEFEAWRKERG